MDETPDETVLRVAHEEARRMAPRVRRRYDFNEILAVAWLGARLGRPSYKPGHHGELAPYVATCAKRYVSRWLWLNSSVVSAAINDRYALGAVAVDALAGPGEAPAVGVVARAGTYEVDIDFVAYRQACGRIDELVASSAMGEVVRAVVIEDERPAAVAERTGVERNEIYRACASVRAKIKRDPSMRRIVEDIWQK